MIVVTGGAGFVGGNLVRALNLRGHDDVVVVDDLSDPRQLRNVAHAELADFIAIDRFRTLMAEDDRRLGDVSLVLHQGASSSTTEPDSRYVLDNNYEYTRELVDHCVRREVPIIYASSAAVYGSATSFAEVPANEAPLNVYGWSKLLADRHVRRVLAATTSQIVGLRYFNVYGPGEDHKDEMASIVTQLDDEIQRSGTATIFGRSPGVEAGQQERDFVSVEDVVEVVMWFAERPDRSGVFNCGTGAATTFETVARAVIDARGAGELAFKEFPTSLVGRYQSSTAADLTALRATGCDHRFLTPAEGIHRYLTDRHRDPETRP